MLFQYHASSPTNYDDKDDENDTMIMRRVIYKVLSHIIDTHKRNKHIKFRTL